MATFADPDGAEISVWQPGRHRGSLAVNEHGGVNFNDLYTHDLDAAASFYDAVFGWKTLDMPWVRTTTIEDPQGAVFVASQFKPENKDLATG